jgi:hypothetical protein
VSDNLAEAFADTLVRVFFRWPLAWLWSSLLLTALAFDLLVQLPH